MLAMEMMLTLTLTRVEVGGVATTSLDGDNLGTIGSRGYTANGDYSATAQIRVAQVGDAGSNFIGGRINFRTTNTDGTERTAIVIDPDQLVKIINNDLYVENNLGIGSTNPAAPTRFSSSYPTATIQRNHAVNYPRLRLINIKSWCRPFDGIGDGSPTVDSVSLQLLVELL